MIDLATALYVTSRKHLIEQRPGHARFAFFARPQPEAVIAQFARLGLDVRRWEVDGRQEFIDVWYERSESI